MILTFEAVRPDHPDAMNIVEELSSALFAITGSSGKSSFANEDMDDPRSVFLLAKSDGQAVGCGALRRLDDSTCELKRMFVRDRRKGVGALLLSELELRAAELGYTAIRLETRKSNHAATAFYTKQGYTSIPNFGKYAGKEYAICFEKKLEAAIAGGRMRFRVADVDDVTALARMNLELIRDESHRNPMDVGALEKRMRAWLDDRAYEAVIFEDETRVPAGYALWRTDDGGVYVRQLFVSSECRRSGVGRAALSWLRETRWPQGARVTVEVLVGNAQALSFWRAVGFEDYCITLEG